jgi:hypothetical protein
MLLTAASAFGIQPGPTGLHLLALFLAAYPWIILVARPWINNRGRFDFLAGAFMIAVTAVYVAVAQLLSP